MAPAAAGDPTPRWQATGVMQSAPTRPLVLPVRDMRVLYGLKHRHYAGFAESHIPHAHEYFVPMDALTAENAQDNPKLQALIGRAAVSANFLAQ